MLKIHKENWYPEGGILNSVASAKTTLSINVHNTATMSFRIESKFKKEQQDCRPLRNSLWSIISGPWRCKVYEKECSEYSTTTLCQLLPIEDGGI